MGVPIPYFAALTTYFSYGLLFVFGHLRDWFRTFFRKNRPPKGYAPLCRDFEDFYTRNLYHRIQDCWNRPISSAPDAWIDVIERTRPAGSKPLQRLPETRHCLNLGSYNYLGFAAADEYCTDRVVKSLHHYSASTCSSRMEVGTTELHVELEEMVARFVGKPAAIVYGMGFATNSTTLPAMAGKGTLLISDSLNHSSIVTGARASGAKIAVFQHNIPSHLEQVLRESIVEGQPRTHRPWKKIIIIVEGIYSMEGEICRLPEIVELKKKYKAYLYLDEAHSIGALGRTGRGACEQTGVDPADVDVMMGTFTKSFGSCGGYLAGSEEFVAYLRHTSPGSLYATAMSPPAVQQCISSFKVLLGEDGTTRGQQKLRDLHDNANWFRSELRKLGVEVLGDEDSPVMPVMLYNPAKIPAFSRECLKRNIAVVVVGFPATPLLLSRARVCISASHTRADLEHALRVLNEVSDVVSLKYMPVALDPLEIKLKGL
ncbi:Long-Chain Base 1 [Klebsormidium nitens]|uniref:serine C-palmitoyltransferase n=1 Tax=Klebsormidium nitens TaxID=105231 RepID=A0A1Y1HWZ6_KLENI|nr:Long-Chain Base 1 [Klebsormidium nitens]|eukprot:GAQ81699.1 Long-Chain Base 1 [Klebsormidium nitens]